jgi:NADPH2:quinone reductase
MKAVAITEFGGPEVLQTMALPRPEPAQGQILVRVHACGLNPVDFKIRAGMLAFPSKFPLILGYDVSGTVVEVGPGVREFAVGDEVFYMVGIDRGGALAEFHAVEEEAVSLKPPDLSHVEAASIPLAGSTAWQTLIDRAGAGPGAYVLIHGAAGGVGSLAVQIASWLGCEVFVTAGPKNHDFLRSLGVDGVFDYGSDNLAGEILDATGGTGIDLVLDTVGGETFLGAFDLLAPHGHVVTIVPSLFDGFPDEFLTSVFSRNATAHFHLVEPSRYTLDDLARLLERGFLLPIVEEVIPFQTDALSRAHRRLETGHGRGKIVVDLMS